MLASTALYAGLLTALVGAVGLIHPVGMLRIRERRRGAIVAGAGLALVGAAALWPSRLVRSASAASGEASIDAWMPAYHFNERHSRHVDAPPERVYAAIGQVRPAEIRFFLLLIGIRRLNVKQFFGRDTTSLASPPPLLQVSRDGGFLLLDEQPGREIVQGVCSQFWRLRGRARCPGVQTPRELIAFSEPGYAKAAINFRVVPEGDGTRLTTETRILATDPGACRRFAAYWRLIYPGSALIRRSWLAAIARRAESPAETRPKGVP